MSRHEAAEYVATYLALVQAALAEEVRSGEVVYHGHVGHLLLQGGGPVLRVRVIAPLESRIGVAQVLLRHVWIDESMVAASAAVTKTEFIVKLRVARLCAHRLLEQADGFFTLLPGTIPLRRLKQQSNRNP